MSLPDVLAQVPNTDEGRKFVEELAKTIFSKFGIWVTHTHTHAHTHARTQHATHNTYNGGSGIRGCADALLLDWK